MKKNKERGGEIRLCNVEKLSVVVLFVFVLLVAWFAYHSANAVECLNGFFFGGSVTFASIIGGIVYFKKPIHASCIIRLEESETYRNIMATVSDILSIISESEKTYAVQDLNKRFNDLDADIQKIPDDTKAMNLYQDAYFLYKEALGSELGFVKTAMKKRLNNLYIHARKQNQKLYTRSLRYLAKLTE